MRRILFTVAILVSAFLYSARAENVGFIGPNFIAKTISDSLQQDSLALTGRKFVRKGNIFLTDTLRIHADSLRLYQNGLNSTISGITNVNIALDYNTDNTAASFAVRKDGPGGNILLSIAENGITNLTDSLRVDKTSVFTGAVRMDGTLQVGASASPINAFLYSTGSTVMGIVFDSGKDTLWFTPDSTKLH